LVTASLQRGDVLIRDVGKFSLQLVDADTHEAIAIVSSISEALKIAGDLNAAVWRENVDNRGRAFGPPILLMPRPSSTAH
jgi:hypothetical protein